MYHSSKTLLLWKRTFPYLGCKVHLHDLTKRRKDIDKILVANRGEIACRIARTAKKLGIKVVAVYSEVESSSMHLDLADEAYCIGPAQSSQSYLRQDKIISVAKNAKCQAIHPGYGFLSENTEFAELCQKENLIFIGPPANAIRDMGIKNKSKSIMSEAGVPVIAGYHGDDQSKKKLLLEARKISFPLMIKAVRGGGGKGMRIVQREEEFFSALESAKTESQKAFGDSAVLLEKYVIKPRHVEVQVFGDEHGNVVHLFERDCSVQRRHQKVIEEAPAPSISKELRSELGATAVRAAKAVGYVGAGTVEFILDRSDNSFYFMEMNTRLQVEHPITEAITGLDLVEWQFKVAAGDPLPLKQEEIRFEGHAFEARIYAESPRNGFLPGTGRLKYLRFPEITPNVRVETGVREKDEVLIYYDPMIAKLVVWGKNRKEALQMLRARLCEYNIAGLDTNVEFLKDLCAHPAFQNGQIHTGFIEENSKALFPTLYMPDEVILQGTLALILHEEVDSLSVSLKTSNPLSPFATETGFRLNHKLIRTIRFRSVEGKDIEVSVKYEEPEVYLMRVNNLNRWKRVSGTLKKVNNALELSTEIEQVVKKARIAMVEDKIHLFTTNREWQLIIPGPKFALQRENETQMDIGSAINPMPGVVDKIFVQKGEKVKKNDPLLVIVAMKMEHVIRSNIDGIVDDILCSVGDNVPKKKILVKLSEDVQNYKIKL